MNYIEFIIYELGLTLWLGLVMFCSNIFFYFDILKTKTLTLYGFVYFKILLYFQRNQIQID